MSYLSRAYNSEIVKVEAAMRDLRLAIAMGECAKADVELGKAYRALDKVRYWNYTKMTAGQQVP